MKIKQQRDIFIAFCRSGMLGYGGGLSAIPLMRHEVVDTFGWMDEEEFADVLALANTLPGPINTKLAGYIGWRIGGWFGMLNAIIAAAIPSLILMILLLTVLNAYKDRPWVQGMAKGVIPVAGVMIGVLAWDFIRLSKQLMGWKTTIILTGISILIMEVLGIHPALLILGIFIIIFIQRDRKDERKRAER